MKAQSSGHEDEDLVEQVVAPLLEQPDPMVRYQRLSRAQEMYEAVARRIASERARAVADMKTTGMSYGQIAESIGFTRARAQQLAERALPAPAPSQPPVATGTSTLTAFLERYLRLHGWPREPQSVQVARATPVPPLMAQRYSAEALATELFADPDFRALQLGTWLRTPDAKQISAAVDALAARPYQQDAALLVEAVALAAQLQQEDSRRRAVAAGVVLAFLGAVALSGRD